MREYLSYFKFQIFLARLLQEAHLVFKFPRPASVEGVAYIFLFGSVAKGNANRRWDVDILVVLDTFSQEFDSTEAKTRISELALTL